MNKTSQVEIGELSRNGKETTYADKALYRARKAAEVWGETTISRRTRYLRRVRKFLVRNQEGVVDAVMTDTGRPSIEVLSGDLMTTVHQLHYYEKNARKYLANERRDSPFLYFGQKARVQRWPYGAVAVISPWNFPVQLSLVPALTAVVAGNSVLLKPSEKTPTVNERLRELFASVAGPEHLVQVLDGGPEVGEQLVSAGPDKIFFTGSKETGVKIRKKAAEMHVPVDLELGGKDPMIVCSDANVSRAAKAAAWGAFCNAGQMCVSIERAYVHEDVYDQFLEALMQATSSLETGTEAEVGPLMDEQQKRIVESQIEAALSAGATARTDVVIDGNLISPVVLTNVDHSMEVMKEETFGPVLGVMSYSARDEAIRLANDSPYGLNASVFSGSKIRAREIADRLDVGNCYINNVVTNIGNPDLPFGGTGASGQGRYHGPEGLHAFTQTTSIMEDGGSKEDEIHWYPYTQKLYESLRSLVRLKFGDESFPRKLREILHLLRKICRGELK